MAAVMSSEIDNTDKLLGLRDECRRMGLTVQANVLEGSTISLLMRKGTLFMVWAVSRVWVRGQSGLLAAREEKPFADLFDLCSRTDPRKVNRRALSTYQKWCA